MGSGSVQQNAATPAAAAATAASAIPAAAAAPPAAAAATAASTALAAAAAPKAAATFQAALKGNPAPEASRKGAREEDGHSTTTPAAVAAPAASVASTGDALIAGATVVHEGTIRKATALDRFLIECGVGRFSDAYKKADKECKQNTDN